MRWWKPKFNWRDSHLPEAQCPYCKFKHNGAVSPEGYTPSPGDYSICKECASILRFGDNLELLPVLDDELNTLEIENPELMEQMTVMQEAVRNMDRRPKT